MCLCVFKAQEDAEKLRSVVMPMEHEIAALKARLTTAEDRVRELEASKASQRRVTPSRWLPSSRSRHT